MRNNTNLHELIGAMTGVEKAYFKKYARSFTGKRAPHYLELFDLIRKQKTYDEGQLKLVLLQRGSTYADRLAVEKQYLYDLLLEALGKFQSAKAPKDEQCIQLAREADLLFRKGLIRQAGNRLNRAKRMAVKHDLYVAQRFVQERELRFEVFLSQKASKKTEKIYHAISATNKHLENTNTYRILNHNMEMLVNGTSDKSWSDLKTLLTEKMQHPYLSDPASASGYISKMFFHSIHREYHFMMKDYGTCLSHATEYLRLLHQKTKTHSPYIITYAKIKIVEPLLAMNREQEALSFQKEIEQDCRKHPHLNKVYVELCYPLFAEHYLRHGKPYMFNTLLQSYQAYLLKHRLKEDPSITYRMHVSRIRYELEYGSPREALKYLQPLINLKTGTLREPLQLTVKLLEVVVHVALKNVELVLARIQSTRHWLKETGHYKGSWVFPYLKLMEALAKGRPKTALQSAFSKLAVADTCFVAEKALGWFGFLERIKVRG